jgi:hypothetical protein
MAGGGILAHYSGYSFLAGVAGGVTFGMLPLLVLGAIVGLMFLWCPERPICICGKCRSEDYDFIGPMSKPEDNTFYYKCSLCGREYRCQGSKFDLKTAQGYSPYMEISRWRRWKRSVQQTF